IELFYSPPSDKKGDIRGTLAHVVRVGDQVYLLDVYAKQEPPGYYLSSAFVLGNGIGDKYILTTTGVKPSYRRLEKLDENGVRALLHLHYGRKLYTNGRNADAKEQLLKALELKNDISTAY